MSRRPNLYQRLYTGREDRAAERLRQMYVGRKGNAVARAYARLWAAVFALGLQPRRWVTLEVAGARSGQPRRFPLGMADLDGHWYLVSMLGECAWTRNVRAAAGRASIVRRRSRPVLLTEVDGRERARVMQRYLQVVPGGRPHIPVAPDAPFEEIAAVAPHHPTFRITWLDRSGTMTG